MSHSPRAQHPTQQSRTWLACCLATMGALGAACNRGGFAGDDSRLQAEPMAVRFAAKVGETITAVPITVSLASGNPFSWRAVAGAPWLVLTPSSGDGPTTIWIGARTTDLAPGVYRTALHLYRQAGDAAENSVAVGVELSLSAPGWTSLTGPVGGSMVTLAGHPVSKEWIVAGDSSGGVYVSADGGRSFLRSGGALPNAQAVALALSDGDVGYLATYGGGVWRTADRGLSWEPTALQVPWLSGLALDPGQPDLVLAQGAELWRSTNGGLDWSAVNLTTATDFVTVDPNAPGVFVAGDDQGTLYRGDGTSFVAIATGTTFELDSFTSLSSGRWLISHYPSSYSSDEPGVSISDDQGASWQPAVRNLGFANLFHERLSVTADGEVLWVLRENEDVVVSYDAGETYARVPLAFAPAAESGRNLRRIWPTAEGALASSAGEGILRYATAESTVGFSRTQIFAHEISFADDCPATGTLVLLTSAGQMFAYDSATGFRGLYGQGSEGSYRGILIDPRNPFVIHAIFSRWNNGVLRTLDGGATWEHTTSVDPQDLGRAPGAPDVLWLTASEPSGLYRSLDNGLSWTWVTAAGSRGLVALSAEVVLLNTAAGDLLRFDATTNQAPMVFDGDGSLSLMTRTPDGSVWLVDGELYRSLDDGQTFAPLALSPASPRAIAVHPADATQIFVGTNSGLLVSTDGGQSWTDAGSPFGVTRLIMTPEAKLYVGTSRGGLYEYAP